MMIRKPRIVLVCLCLFTVMFTAHAMAWNFLQAAATNDARENLLIPTSPQAKAITKVKPQPITKCRPPYGFQQGLQTMAAQTLPPVLPGVKLRGWNLEAQAMFARTKGKAIFWNNNYGYNYNYLNGQPEVDFNTALGIPDHTVIGSFTAKYRFQPRWSVKYSIMPTTINGGGGDGSGGWGGTWNYQGQGARSKWERLYQQIGLVYDPILTPTSRVGIFADYVRLNERVSVFQTMSGTGGFTFDNDLNMAMAGIEVEKMLKFTRLASVLSLECKAGVAFCDDALGSDMSTGLKYSIPLNNGRSGFLKGGYRYLTYKKKYSDAKMIDTCMDGGFVEMGFVF